MGDSRRSLLNRSQPPQAQEPQQACPKLPLSDSLPDPERWTDRVGHNIRIGKRFAATQAVAIISEQFMYLTCKPRSKHGRKTAASAAGMCQARIAAARNPKANTEALSQMRHKESTPCEERQFIR